MLRCGGGGGGYINYSVDGSNLKRRLWHSAQCLVFTAHCAVRLGYTLRIAELLKRTTANARSCLSKSCCRPVSITARRLILLFCLILADTIQAEVDMITLWPRWEDSQDMCCGLGYGTSAGKTRLLHAPSTLSTARAYSSCVSAKPLTHALRAV